MEVISGLEFLLVYSTALFAVVQFFDVRFTNRVQSAKRRAEKIVIPLSAIFFEGTTLGKRWGEIERFDHHTKTSYDVFLLSIVILLFPLLTSAYYGFFEFISVFGVNPPAGLREGVFPIGMTVLPAVVFALSVYSMVRIMIQRGKIRKLNRMMEDFEEMAKLAVEFGEKHQVSQSHIPDSG